MDPSFTRGKAERVFVSGPAGRIETVIDTPHADAAAQGGVAPAPRGLALCAHPHPLYGGTLDNKVVQTLAHTLAELGYVALRPNFRGVGETEGAHDYGNGETEDMLAVLAYAKERFGPSVSVSGKTPAVAQPAGTPLVLAGYSFGSHVQARVAQQLLTDDGAAQRGVSLERMVFIGAAAGFVSGGRNYTPLAVPANTIVIHGEVDTTVPLANVFDWLRPQDIPVTVIPGADHFFHRKLHIIRAIVTGQWK